ncbi:MAG: hypothetical protein WBQ27_03445, partial [Thermoanaerobaculia bacterium]
MRTAPKRAVGLCTEKKEPGPEGPRLENASGDLAVRLPAPAVALAYARAAIVVEAARSVLWLADSAGRIDAVAVEIVAVD